MAKVEIVETCVLAQHFETAVADLSIISPGLNLSRAAPVTSHSSKTSSHTHRLPAGTFQGLSSFRKTW